MEQKTKKVLGSKFIAPIVIAGVIIVGTAVYFIVKAARKKKLEGEVLTLLNIAKAEGQMSEPDYQKFRKLMYVQDYRLPSNLFNAFEKIKPLLISAGNSIRSGYAQSSQQYFSEIRGKIDREPAAVKNMYNTVESLLSEAFKLGATSATIQDKINSSKRKSASFWQSLLYLHPIGTVYNVRSGYTESQWEDAKRFFDEQTISLLPENVAFNTKLLSQDFNTLKLFNDAYSALSGGKDYFALQKTPNG